MQFLSRGGVDLSPKALQLPLVAAQLLGTVFAGHEIIGVFREALGMPGLLILDGKNLKNISIVKSSQKIMMSAGFFSMMKMTPPSPMTSFRTQRIKRVKKSPPPPYQAEIMGKEDGGHPVLFCIAVLGHKSITFE